MINFTTPSFGDKRPKKPKPLFSVLRKNNKEQEPSFNKVDSYIAPLSPIPIHPLATTSSSATTLPLPSNWNTVPNHTSSPYKYSNNINDDSSTSPYSVSLVDEPVKRHTHKHRHNTIRSSKQPHVSRHSSQFLGGSQREEAYAARQAALDKLCGRTPPATVADFTTDITTIPSPSFSHVQQPYHAPSRQLTISSTTSSSSTRRYHQKQQNYTPLLPPATDYPTPPENNNNIATNNSSSTATGLGRQQTIKRKPTTARRHHHRPHVPTGYFLPTITSPSNHYSQYYQAGGLTPPPLSPARKHQQQNKSSLRSRRRKTPLTPTFNHQSHIKRKSTTNIQEREEDDNLPLIHTVTTWNTNNIMMNTQPSQSEYFKRTLTTSDENNSSNNMLNTSLRPTSFVSEFTSDSETDSITSSSTSDESENNEERIVSLTQHMQTMMIVDNSNNNNTRRHSRSSFTSIQL